MSNKPINSHSFLKILIAGTASCICLSGCASIIENFFMSEKEYHEKIQRIHEDPHRMIEDADRERQSEPARDLQRQDQKENSARERKFNEMLEKQLQNQKDSKP